MVLPLPLVTKETPKECWKKPAWVITGMVWDQKVEFVSVRYYLPAAHDKWSISVYRVSACLYCLSYRVSDARMWIYCSLLGRQQQLSVVLTNNAFLHFLCLSLLPDCIFKWIHHPVSFPCLHTAKSFLVELQSKLNHANVFMFYMYSGIRLWITWEPAVLLCSNLAETFTELVSTSHNYLMNYGCDIDSI